MQPLYKEYTEFLKSHNIDTSWYKEKHLWLDNRSIIKFFDRGGYEHKVCRIMIDINPEYKPNHSDFTLSIKYYPDKDKIDELAVDWNAVIEIFNEDLEEKILTAKEFILSTYNTNLDKKFFVSTSTGKDSTVTVDLVEKVLQRNQYEIAWCNTSLDSADTYRIVNAHKDWAKLNPKEGFYNWIKRLNFIPTRFSRGCCNVYKEQATMKNYSHIKSAIWIMGLRNSESNTRSSYEEIRTFPQWEKAKLDWLCCSPILKWTDLDVWLYILKYNLEINPKYKKGYTRVGCSIACPFYTKATWSLDEYWYSKAYKRWHNILQQNLVRNKRWTTINCTDREYHFHWNGGTIRDIPTEEVKFDMMKDTGLDRRVVDNYFNHKCDKCGVNITNANVLSMNLKYHGRYTETFLCKKCFKNEFGWTNKDWDNQISEFQSQGCELF